MHSEITLEASHALAAWFDVAARDLPWRTRRDGYATWIAETMLQQTRVDVVDGYYRRWMQRYPTVDALASASEHDVLAAWEGLGYYARARRLHQAAKIVAGRFGGRLPADEETLRTLPGIGPYAAAAIAAFAFGVRTVAVDGNVRRVGSRLLGDPRPSDATLRRRLEPLLPSDRPAIGTEALIELGATVCTPRRPACDDCPLVGLCVAARDGTQAQYPAPRVRKPATVRSTVGWVVVRHGRVWLVRRRTSGLLGGMWGVPQRPTASRSDVPHVDLPGRTRLPPVRHVYSHIDLTVVPMVVVDGEPPMLGDDEEEGAWVAFDRLTDLPCSRVDRKILDAVDREGLLR